MYDISYLTHLGLNCVERVISFVISSYCQHIMTYISLRRTEWGLKWVIFLYSSLHILIENFLFNCLSLLKIWNPNVVCYSWLPWSTSYGNGLAVNGSGRFTCAISLLAGMYGLVLQVPVMFPAVTYVKMHLVCMSFFTFLLFHMIFRNMPLVFGRRISSLRFFCWKPVCSFLLLWGRREFPVFAMWHDCSRWR